MSRIFWCKKCLNMSTRPRIEFNEDQICNACQWSEEKKTLNWNDRKKELIEIINKYKKSNGQYDCIVPVSGGKDSSYVSYKLKNEYGINPLTITVKPGIVFDIGEENLTNFISSGYDNITIRPNLKVLKQVDKIGFIEFGRPMLGWQTIIQAFIPKIAKNFNIQMIFYGENGEIEYGGSTKNKNVPYGSFEFVKNILLSDTYNRIINSGIDNNDLEMYKFDEDIIFGKSKVLSLYWSYFEPWDSYRNFKIAEKYCGLTSKKSQEGSTYNDYSQNDTSLYDLHTYLMYLKFGFGRASQDAGIDIRRGAISRKEAIELVIKYDGIFPEIYLEGYLKYYDLTKEEFDNIIDKWANKDLFFKKDGVWIPKFKVGNDFQIG
ncbi:N-acetyl sugar amidotransferase [Campylobacter concisus]|nr:N-acetyl sugar amidotransferase [Campylobacter concisus]